ncbi:hypothetical protein P4132_30710 [Pseudomonas aeruginosa]|nr:hypothetical protein [Pseudomonas aeruginosa]
MALDERRVAQQARLAQMVADQRVEPGAGEPVVPEERVVAVQVAHLLRLAALVVGDVEFRFQRRVRPLRRGEDPVQRLLAQLRDTTCR